MDKGLIGRNVCFQLNINIESKNHVAWLSSHIQRAGAMQLSISATNNTTAITYFTQKSMNFTLTNCCNKHMAANNDILLSGVPLEGAS